VRLPATVEEARLPVRGARRISLALEILRSYLRARRLLHGKDLPSTVAALRSQEAVEPEAVSDPYIAWVIGARLARAVVRTFSILPTDTRCLMRSLVLTDLLARRRIGSTLVIGVTSGEDFSAHAWVEKDGAPLFNPQGDTYERLVEL
jgi:hypothetical protein